MESKEVAENVVNSLMPRLTSYIENLVTFDHFFKNIQKILLIDDCILKSSDKLNPATEDGTYPNQKILRIKYNNKTINFDLKEGGLIDDTWQIFTEKATITELSNFETPQIVKYSEEEILEQYFLVNDLNAKFKPFKYSCRCLDKETFQDKLKNEYNVELLTPEPYIMIKNCKLFANIDLENKIIELNGYASFFKNDVWQDKINLEDELQKMKKEETSNGAIQ